MDYFQQKQRDLRDAACGELESIGAPKLVTMLVNARAAERNWKDKCGEVHERLDYVTNLVTAAKAILCVALPNQSDKMLLELCEIARQRIEEKTAPF